MPKQRALAATAPAHDDQCFAAMNVERDVVDHRTVPELTNQIGNFDDW